MIRITRVLWLSTALTLTYCAFAMAQQTDVYQVTYFANANNAFSQDQAIHIVNPGMEGNPLSTSPPKGNVCASLYIYDANQNLQECCTCPISANGKLTFQLLGNLLQNPTNGSVPSSGVIKLVSTAFDTETGACNQFLPVPNLRASMEHLEIIPPVLPFSPFRSPFQFLYPGTPFLALAPFQNSVLSENEFNKLTADCAAIVNACTCATGG